MSNKKTRVHQVCVGTHKLTITTTCESGELVSILLVVEDADDVLACTLDALARSINGQLKHGVTVQDAARSLTQFGQATLKTSDPELQKVTSLPDYVGLYLEKNFTSHSK